MDAVTRPIVTLADLPLDQWEQGAFYQAADASFGQRIGLKGLGASYNEVPPGKSSCPFHNHHVEDEMFIVLAGEGTYRFGSARYAVKAGDVLGAPAGGPDTAHQLINTGSTPLRYIGVSTMAATEVCEYPDSGKFQVSSRAGAGQPERHFHDIPGRLRHMSRGTETSLDYWDGEPGA